MIAKKLVKVYISGPITKGDRQHNFDQSVDIQKQLIALGFAPLNPVLTMKVPDCWDIPWETWIEIDLEWIAVTDCVLRLPGESRGADEECQFAFECSKPVFDSIEELAKFYGVEL